MARRNRVSGVDLVIRSLRREMEAIEGKTLKGFIRAAIVVISATDKETPMVPLDEGNLRASRFVVASDGSIDRGENARFHGDHAGQLSAGHQSVVNGYSREAVAQAMPSVILGFSAYYAWYVHEMVGANFKQPEAGQKAGAQRGAKYLESHLFEKADDIIRIVAEEARIR